MEHVRFNLITTDPLQLGDSVEFIRADVRPRVESQPGSLGTSLYTNPMLGVAVLESFWVSDDAMRESEHAVSPSRREVVRHGAGTVTVERYALPVFERRAPLSAGAGLRLARMDFEPSHIEDAVQAYGDTAVPWLADTEGFCSALLLIDRNAGHSISETMWRDTQTLAASRSVAAAVQADTIAATGGVVRAVEEYGLIFSSAWKPSH